MIAAALLLAQAALGLPPDTAVQEAELLRRFPALAQRRGRELRLLSRNGPVRYRDLSTKACERQGVDCSFRLRDVFLNGRLLGVDVGNYEGEDHELVLDGVPLRVGYPAVVSPDDALAAVVGYAEAYENDGEGVAIYDLQQGIGMRLVRRVAADSVPYADHPEWRGPDCLAFSVFPDARADGERRSMFLIRDRPEWRLTDRPDPACRGDRP